MDTDAAEREGTVEVALPQELLRDIDDFAVRHGYESPSAVVREAIERSD